MIPSQPIRKWRQGQVVSASVLEKQRANAVNDIIAAYPLRVFRQGNATVVKWDGPDFGKSIVVFGKITGNVAGKAGRYTGRMFEDEALTPNAAGALIMDDLGVMPTVDDCEVWHLGETGLNTNILVADTIFVGLLHDDKDNGLPVVLAFPIFVLPNGQYQWMNWTMVSNNQSGWDFPVRAHALL